jgi:hypothetical protein
MKTEEKLNKEKENTKEKRIDQMQIGKVE